MTRDYSADSYEIADRLTEQGHSDWADRIRSAIKSGFTSTEILMALRWELGNLIGADLGLDDDTLALAESLHADINDALR